MTPNPEQSSIPTPTPKKTNIHSRISSLEHLVYAATERVGSPASLVIHSIFFVGIFGLSLFGWKSENILLLLTTVVSLEAIYLAIFIQMTINRQAQELREVSEDVDEIREDVEDIAENMEEVSEDIEGIQKEVQDIGEDIEEDKTEIQTPVIPQDQLNKIETTLQKLLEEIEKTKQR